MDVQPHRAARPSGHAQSDVFPGSLVPPPFQNPQRTVATLFGTITLWRLYQPLHGVEPSIFPLEIRLGLEVGLATPAFTRVGQAAVTSSQNSVLEYLKRNHGVSWSVATLRKVIAGLSEGMESHRHDASVAQVLKWLEQAYASRGGRKPVLAVGRDGLMLPIRGQRVIGKERRRPSRSTIGRDGDWGRCTWAGCPSQGKNVIAPVDSLDRGRVAPMERAIAAVGLHHGRATIRPSTSAGFSSGCDIHDAPVND